MNIEMSDQEKSVMLARLCGWEVCYYGDTSKISTITDNRGIVIFHLHSERSPTMNLYTTALMSLAWRVSNFVHSEFFNGEDWCDGYFTWWHEVDWYKYEPADAQRAWLDKILSLAIEAGMVTE